MGRGSRTSVDCEDLQELRALRQGIHDIHKDPDELHQEVSLIKADICGQSTQMSPCEVVDAVGEMHSVVGAISLQLITVAEAQCTHPTNVQPVTLLWLNLQQACNRSTNISQVPTTTWSVN